MRVRTKKSASRTRRGVDVEGTASNTGIQGGMPLRLMGPRSRQEGGHGERRGQWPEVEKEKGITAHSSLTSCEQETGLCEACMTNKRGHSSWSRFVATVVGTATVMITCVQ